MLKKRFKEYFNFTKRERNGVIVLLFILTLVVAVNFYFNHRNYGQIALMTDDFQSEVDDFLNSLELKKKETSKDAFIEKTEVTKKFVLFNFDPNSASKDELERLGFNSYQISTLLNYREKGGIFSNKEDLLKIYGIDDEFYQVVKHYIVIDTSGEKEYKKEKSIKNYVPTIQKVEINSAQREDLISLPGIGESYANRIISYKKLLGGFYQKEQLLEVYGMDQERYNQIDTLIRIDTSIISKLNINKVRYKTLLRHPYLSKYQTSSIMKYRELNGKFNSIDELTKYNLLDESDYMKIRPYLITDTVN